MTDHADHFGLSEEEHVKFVEAQTQEVCKRILGNANINIRMVEEAAIAAVPPDASRFNPRKSACDIVVNGVSRALGHLAREHNVSYSL